jgi:predicted PurR-regulated permease PerM
VIDKQLHHNPRWSVDSTNAIVIRQRPYMVSAAIPSLPKNATLVTVQPLSNTERITKQQVIVELENQVKGMQQLLTAKQTALNTTYPWYKKIGHALLLVIATLMTAAAMALCLHMLYRLLKFFLSPLQRGNRAIPSKL